MKIKRVNPKSLGKVLGLLYAIIGLIIGAVVTLFGLIGSGTGQGALGIVMGVGAIIFLPIFYGLMGLVGGYISAWIYNFAAKKVGGIEVDVE